MKKILFALLGIGLWTACGGSDDPSNPEPQIEAPRFVSSTPANGATEIPDGQLTVELLFDQNVTTPADRQSKVTVSEGATVKSVSSYLKSVKIALEGLVKERHLYPLSIPYPDRSPRPHLLALRPG